MILRSGFKEEFEVRDRKQAGQHTKTLRNEQLWSTVTIISTLSTAKAQYQSHWAWVWSGLTCPARKSTTSVRIYSVYLTKGTQHWTPQDKNWDICRSSTPLGFIWPPVIWSQVGSTDWWFWVLHPFLWGLIWSHTLLCGVRSSNGVAPPEDDQDPTSFHVKSRQAC